MMDVEKTNINNNGPDSDSGAGPETGPETGHDTTRDTTLFIRVILFLLCTYAFMTGSRAYLKHEGANQQQALRKQVERVAGIIDIKEKPQKSAPVKSDGLIIDNRETIPDPEDTLLSNAQTIVFHLIFITNVVSTFFYYILIFLMIISGVYAAIFTLAKKDVQEFIPTFIAILQGFWDNKFRFFTIFFSFFSMFSNKKGERI